MIPKSIRLTKANVLHRLRVRSSYSTVEGRMELMRLLLDLGAFREITAEELPLRNFAIRKLEELGFLDEHTVEETIHFLFQTPIHYGLTAEELAEKKDSEYGLLKAEGEDNA